MALDSNTERILALIQDGLYPTPENIELFAIQNPNNATERVLLSLSALIGNLANSTPVRNLLDNTAMDTIITDGLAKGIVLLDEYTDENGNTALGLIVVHNGNKYLIPTLQLP